MHGAPEEIKLVPGLGLKLFAVVVNFLVLCELAVAMYWAFLHQETYTESFFKMFLGLALPTIAVAFIGKRILGRKRADGAEKAEAASE